MPAYRMLGLRYSCSMFCINNRMVNSGYSSLMLQILKQVIALFVLCVTLKQSFAFFLPFWIGVYKPMGNKHSHIQYFGLGYISLWKINTVIFSIHWVAIQVLSYVSVFLLHLCPSYLIFLIHTSILWNVEPHRYWTPTDVTPTCGYDMPYNLL